MENLTATILTSAVVATVAGATINAWLESRKTKTATKLEALTAAVALEGHALNCADKISDHKLAVDSGGHAGSPIGGIPELPQLSIVAGFLRPKKSSVADRLMTFPQELAQAEQKIHFWWSVTADPDETGDVAVEQHAIIGLKALELAEDLRKAFSLPARELKFGEFDAKTALTENAKERR